MGEDTTALDRSGSYAALMALPRFFFGFSPKELAGNPAG
jgi:hypothetical protein